MKDGSAPAEIQDQRVAPPGFKLPQPASRKKCEDVITKNRCLANRIDPGPLERAGCEGDAISPTEDRFAPDTLEMFVDTESAEGAGGKPAIGVEAPGTNAGCEEHEVEDPSMPIVDANLALHNLGGIGSGVGLDSPLPEGLGHDTPGMTIERGHRRSAGIETKLRGRPRSLLGGNPRVGRDLDSGGPTSDYTDSHGTAEASGKLTKFFSRGDKLTNGLRRI
jgi:hypothetical protein